MSIIASILIVAIIIGVTYAVVFIERGQRKILRNYAKRQVGNKVYGGQSSHLPLKLNMAGVIPPIFASSIILFPATIAGWFTSDSTGAVGRFIRNTQPCRPASRCTSCCTRLQSYFSASSIRPWCTTAVKLQTT